MVVGYQTKTVVTENRKHLVHEYNGRAIKLTQGNQPGEQIVTMRETDQELVIMFVFARYEQHGRYYSQVRKHRLVTCRPEWIGDGGDFVWTQRSSVVF